VVGAGAQLEQGVQPQQVSLAEVQRPHDAPAGQKAREDRGDGWLATQQTALRRSLAAQQVA